MLKTTAQKIARLRDDLRQFPCGWTWDDPFRNMVSRLVEVGMVEEIWGKKPCLQLTELGRLTLAILMGQVPVPPEFKTEKDPNK